MSQVGSATILVVDDNVNQCETLSMILKFKGYQVTTAPGGLEAVDAVRRQPFDLVLMDIKMPGMNGVEAYLQMKGLRPQLQAMLMTAYAVDDLLEEALQLGVMVIAYKPLDIDDLLNRIEKATGSEKV